MGKIPHALRSAIANPLLRRNPASSSYPVPSPTPSPHQPRHSPQKKPSRFPAKSPKHCKQTHPSESPQLHALFKSPSLSDAKSVFNSLINSSQSSILDLRFLNGLLQSYASIATTKDSIAFLRHMFKTGNAHSISPDRSTYHVLLSQSGKSPDSDLAGVHQILNLMVSNGVNPDKVTTDVAVRSLCAQGLLDNAVELVKELSSKHNSLPDNNTFNFIVKNFCKSLSLSTIYGFIDEMRSNFGINSDLG